MSENIRLTKKFIWRKVYDWGVCFRKLPMFKTVDEEIKHYGKPLSAFTKRERKEFDDAMYELEKFFETYPVSYEI